MYLLHDLRHRMGCAASSLTYFIDLLGYSRLSQLGSPAGHMYYIRLRHSEEQSTALYCYGRAYTVVLHRVPVASMEDDYLQPANTTSTVHLALQMQHWCYPSKANIL